ncbi:unnamed protein product [Cyprideis torosa]|uniref:Uncharacterized protein n=1 Tax=Cyprideis torosa TaxID=163714 RepID=A0A7R8WRH8_9CRUS|nr:unnamed protein product [Cyprideis torosa]CAG0902602.1 unnamed protein product [Cyprideis torosa]
MESFLKGKRAPKSVKCGEASSSKNSGPRHQRQAPWVEKYRPRTIDDVACQEEVVSVLRSCLTKSGDLPNLLFYGPPGTGKTSTILAICRDLYGPDVGKRILELNASDERGIQVIREKVKNFAHATSVAIRSDGKPCPPYKIIILDEADSLTSAAQSALRRTMETESKATRFCLICNYVTRIIDPITSRCSKFRFKPLDDAVVKSRLLAISQEEKLCIPIDPIIEMSGGDMRRAITLLQSAARLKNPSVAAIRDIAGFIPEEWLNKLLETAAKNSIPHVRNFLRRYNAEGFSAQQVILQLLPMILSLDSLPDIQKAAIAYKMAVCDSHLQDGADEELQIQDLVCCIMKAMTAVKS